MWNRSKKMHITKCKIRQKCKIRHLRHHMKEVTKFYFNPHTMPKPNWCSFEKKKHPHNLANKVLIHTCDGVLISIWAIKANWNNCQKIIQKSPTTHKEKGWKFFFVKGTTETELMRLWCHIEAKDTTFKAKIEIVISVILPHRSGRWDNVQI